MFRVFDFLTFGVDAYLFLAEEPVVDEAGMVKRWNR
jgi:hypothetical protein